MLSGISLPHIILLLVIVILVFGTGKLKNAGKDLGGFFKGFKEGMKGSEEEKPQDPAARLSQSDSTNAQANADKKDHV
jgi:sec-independent protein translocase protein TatA